MVVPNDVRIAQKSAGERTARQAVPSPGPRGDAVGGTSVERDLLFGTPADGLDGRGEPGHVDVTIRRSADLLTKDFQTYRL
jgi:hypothetical protein